MNNPKSLLILLLIFLNINFISCEDEPVDPYLLIPQAPVTACAKPSALAVSDFVGTSVNVIWTASEGSSWEIQYGLEGFTAGSGTSVTSATTSKTINGLTTTNNYDFYVRTICADGSKSGWVGPVAVGGSVVGCTSPTSITALRSATDVTKVTVTWPANGDESSWEVEYGATDFAHGSGTVEIATTTSKVITGLLGNTAYDFYVRSKCSVTEFSAWTGPFHVNAVP